MSEEKVTTLVPLSEEEVSIVNDAYPLVSLNKVALTVSQITKTVQSIPTDRYYTGRKGKYIFVKNNYVEALFKRYFPISKTHLRDKSIVANTWIHYTVEVEAFISSGISISHLGTGSQRINIPQQMRDAIIEGKYPIERLTPLDWIDFDNDAKSALTKAIKNAQVKFGIAEDIYGKGVVPEHIRKDLCEVQFPALLSTIKLTLEKLSVQAMWDECIKNGGNLLILFDRLCNKYNFKIENLNEPTEGELVNE